MMKFTIFPKKVKVLTVKYCEPLGLDSKYLDGTKWIVGRYYISENNRTCGLKVGDKYIVREYHFGLH